MLVVGLAVAGCGATAIAPQLTDPMDDPRFRACLGDIGGTTVAFYVEAAERWADHFPHESNLHNEIKRSGLMVVFPDGWPGVIMGGPHVVKPGHADVCFWTGSRESAADYLANPEGPEYRTIYGNVDITGLRP